MLKFLKNGSLALAALSLGACGQIKLQAVEGKVLLSDGSAFAEPKAPEEIPNPPEERLLPAAPEAEESGNALASTPASVDGAFLVCKLDEIIRCRLDSQNKTQVPLLPTEKAQFAAIDSVGNSLVPTRSNASNSAGWTWDLTDYKVPPQAFITIKLFVTSTISQQSRYYTTNLMTMAYVGANEKGNLFNSCNRLFPEMSRKIKPENGAIRLTLDRQADYVLSIAGICGMDSAQNSLEIQDMSNKVIARINFTKPNRPLQVSLGTIPAGNYKVIIRSADIFPESSFFEEPDDFMLDGVSFSAR